ncbi:MAG: serine hydrolase domain-containing protein [Flexilinea sp.]
MPQKTALCSATQICVKRNEETIFAESYGDISWDRQAFPTNSLTLFDLSSVTGIFTASAFMRLVDEGMVHLDDPVCAILHDFVGFRPILPDDSQQIPVISTEKRDQKNKSVDASKITFRQLLRHSAGLPANRMLFLQENPQIAKASILNSPLLFTPDSDSVYSDLDFMLIGWAIETLCDTDLDTAMDELIFKPLNLTETGFRPLDFNSKVPLPLPAEGIAPTKDTIWRHKWLLGEVNDENCAFLNGVCGHAGLFSTANELADFGQIFLPGADFFKPESLFAMTHVQSASSSDRKIYGLGFQLWSDDPLAGFAPLSSESFGHTGITGNCLWIDPQRDLIISLLTNEIINSKENRIIDSLHAKLIRSIVNDLK